MPISLVWSRPVEVRAIFLEHAGELTFAKDKLIVQALASYAPQAVLARSVGPQGADGLAAATWSRRCPYLRPLSRIRTYLT